MFCSQLFNYSTACLAFVLASSLSHQWNSPGWRGQPSTEGPYDKVYAGVFCGNPTHTVSTTASTPEACYNFCKSKQCTQFAVCPAGNCGEGGTCFAYGGVGCNPISIGPATVYQIRKCPYYESGTDAFCSSLYLERNLTAKTVDDCYKFCKSHKKCFEFAICTTCPSPSCYIFDPPGCQPKPGKDTTYKMCTCPFAEIKSGINCNAGKSLATSKTAIGAAACNQFCKDNDACTEFATCPAGSCTGGDVCFIYGGTGCNAAAGGPATAYSTC